MNKRQKKKQARKRAEARRALQSCLRRAVTTAGVRKMLEVDSVRVRGDFICLACGSARWPDCCDSFGMYEGRAIVYDRETA